MPCEAWKWLAIVTGALALAGSQVYFVFEMRAMWPADDERRLRFLARVRPYVPYWLLCGGVAFVSALIYVAHCT